MGVGYRSISIYTYVYACIYMYIYIYMDVFDLPALAIGKLEIMFQAVHQANQFFLLHELTLVFFEVILKLDFFESCFFVSDVPW